MTKSTAKFLGLVFLALIVYVPYAFLSVPIFNDAPPGYGPYLRIFVVALWLCLGTSIYFQNPIKNWWNLFCHGAISSSIYLFFIFLGIPKALIELFSGSITNLYHISLLLVSVSTYAVISGIFGINGETKAKAFLWGAACFAGQVIVDFCFGGMGLYGPHSFISG